MSLYLGGPVPSPGDDPERWIAALRERGYRAAYCPVDASAPDDLLRRFEAAAARAGILIAEVGAWSNPLSPDEAVRQKALAHCQAQLALADRIGARCCVNISGSRGDRWDGPHPDNLTPETFDLIVETVRAILDAVKPTRTFYALETMPWMFPDSPQSYLELLKAIDRPHFAVHLDPVNLVNNPARYVHSASLLRSCFHLLGPYIQSCHAKDILLRDTLTLHLDEVRPGQGNLDYAVFLTELDRHRPGTPLMLEHLPNEDEYRLAAAHIRSVAAEVGVEV